MSTMGRTRTGFGYLLPLLAMVCVGALAGCALEPTPMPTPLPTATPTVTLTPTRTATPLPTATLTPSPTPAPLSVVVRLAPAQVVQGHTQKVEVFTNLSSQVTLAWGERSALMGTSDGKRHAGFVGVSPVAELGALPVTVQVLAADGRRIALRTELQVVAGEFPFETLQFDAETTKLLAPETTEPELARMHAVYGGSSAPQMLWSGAFAWPWLGAVTSPFGTGRQYGDAFRSFHAGIDLDGEEGDVITAAADGLVLLAETLTVRGNAIVLDHGLGVMSGYYHLSRLDVGPGDRVTKGQAIGLMGQTGLVTGSHLHWEMRVGDVPVSPAQWTEVDWSVALEEMQ